MFFFSLSSLSLLTIIFFYKYSSCCLLIVLSFSSSFHRLRAHLQFFCFFFILPKIKKNCIFSVLVKGHNVLPLYAFFFVFISFFFSFFSSSSTETILQKYFCWLPPERMWGDFCFCVLPDAEWKGADAFWPCPVLNCVPGCLPPPQRQVIGGHLKFSESFHHIFFIANCIWGGEIIHLYFYIQHLILFFFYISQHFPHFFCHIYY